jgi:hypothetical protein
MNFLLRVSLFFGLLGVLFPAVFVLIIGSDVSIFIETGSYLNVAFPLVTPVGSLILISMFSILFSGLSNAWNFEA